MGRRESQKQIHGNSSLAILSPSITSKTMSLEVNTIFVNSDNFNTITGVNITLSN